jgi:hypothetical protein
MKTSLKLLYAAAAFIVAACAIITVNIYFPEKDVKEAYKQLEKELMTPEQEMEQKKSGTPEDQSSRQLPRFELVSRAYAQEPGMADKIAEIVKRMPEVVNAYKDMGARYPETERLRNAGAAGEGNSGLLVIRNEAALTPGDRKVIEEENADRSTVMRGMARAIIRINRLPENDENMRQVLPQAKEQFAAIRRDSAKKGWWVQDPSGNWYRK